MPTKHCTVEIQLDEATLYKLLDDVAEYVNGIPNEKLSKFIKNAFYITNTPSGSGSVFRAVFKPEPRYLELLPSLRAGDISFDSLCNSITEGKYKQ